MSLLSLSAQESSASVGDSRRGIPTLTRQLYVHGITYGLQGLPAKLSNEEKMGIWSALPDDIVELASLETAKRQTIRDEGPSSNNVFEKPSVIHRLLADFIVQVFLLLKFLMPHLRYLVATLYGFERQHRISERVFASGLNTMDGVLRASSSVGRMSDGKVGQVMGNVMVWWIRGITGGIQEGVGEGLAVIGIDPK